MKIALPLAAALCLAAIGASAQERTPYAGLAAPRAVSDAVLETLMEVKRARNVGGEKRDIKALAKTEIDDLLAGRGMGLAKAAELNAYPGPAHALGLVEELGLSAEQVAALGAIRERMTALAVGFGQEIVEREQALDELFAAGYAEIEPVTQATAEIAELQGRLRAAHLAAHIESRAVLSAEQAARYDALRGHTRQTTPPPGQPAAAPTGARGNPYDGLAKPGPHAH